MTQAKALGKAEGMVLGRTKETSGLEQIVAARHLPKKQSLLDGNTTPSRIMEPMCILLHMETMCIYL